MKHEIKEHVACGLYWSIRVSVWTIKSAIVIGAVVCVGVFLTVLISGTENLTWEGVGKTMLVLLGVVAFVATLVGLFELYNWADRNRSC